MTAATALFISGVLASGSGSLSEYRGWHLEGKMSWRGLSPLREELPPGLRVRATGLKCEASTMPAFGAIHTSVPEDQALCPETSVMQGKVAERTRWSNWIRTLALPLSCGPPARLSPGFQLPLSVVVILGDTAPLPPL